MTLKSFPSAELRCHLWTRRRCISTKGVCKWMKTSPNINTYKINDTNVTIIHLMFFILQKKKKNYDKNLFYTSFRHRVSRFRAVFIFCVICVYLWLHRDMRTNFRIVFFSVFHCFYFVCFLIISYSYVYLFIPYFIIVLCVYCGIVAYPIAFHSVLARARPQKKRNTTFEHHEWVSWCKTQK